jgi:hypothetical protein
MNKFIDYPQVEVKLNCRGKKYPIHLSMPLKLDDMVAFCLKRLKSTLSMQKALNLAHKYTLLLKIDTCEGEFVQFDLRGVKESHLHEYIFEDAELKLKKVEQSPFDQDQMDWQECPEHRIQEEEQEHECVNRSMANVRKYKATKN